MVMWLACSEAPFPQTQIPLDQIGPAGLPVCFMLYISLWSISTGPLGAPTLIPTRPYVLQGVVGSPMSCITLLKIWTLEGKPVGGEGCHTTIPEASAIYV